jgi:hypothetical protein
MVQAENKDRRAKRSIPLMLWLMITAPRRRGLVARYKGLSLATSRLNDQNTVGIRDNAKNSA